MTTIELNSKIRELREWKRIADEAASMIDGLTDELKAVMTEQATDILTGDDWKITWKPVTTNRIDSKSLKTAYPDIAAQFTKSSVSRRFVLV